METTEKPQKKPRKLSKKRKGFVRDYVKTGNATEAAERNFNVKDRRVATSVGSELLTFPDVIEEVEKAQKTIAEQIPDELLVKTHLEGLKATQTRFTPEGDKIDVPDYSTRHKFTQLGYQVKKVIGSGDAPPPPPSSTTYNFVFNAETQAKVREMETEIKARLMQHEPIQEN